MYRIGSMCPQPNHCFLPNRLISTFKCGTQSEEYVTVFWLHTEHCELIYAPEGTSLGASPVRKFRSSHSSETGPLELDNALFPAGTGNDRNSLLKRGAILLAGSPKCGYLFRNYVFHYKFSGLSVLNTGSRGQHLQLGESR